MSPVCAQQVYLIGVDHMIQHNGFVVGQHDDFVVDPQKVADAIREFQEYLRQQVKITGATVLAEEFSKDAMSKSRATNSTAKQVARELRIEHLFCDPTKAERERFGICSDDQREDYWARRLVPLKADRILFVCGDKHVVTFPAVLERHGLKSRVLSRGWGCNLYTITNLSDLIGKPQA